MYCIVIPVRDDWESIRVLLGEIDQVLRDASLPARVLLVDDGSREEGAPALANLACPHIQDISILKLKRNLGHQRAIAIGICYVAEQMGDCDALVIMDGDGEDDPHDIPRLINRLNEKNGQAVVFAERTRRVEGLRFRFFYHLYCLLHHVLTGKRVRFGNFSALPMSIARRLGAVAELWNHYVAAVLKVGLPYVSLPTSRRKRIAGTSKMNFDDLVVHGLSALSVFSETIGVRAIRAVSWLAGLSLLLFFAVTVVRLTTTLAIPGWTSTISILLLLLLLQSLSLALVFVFLILNNRSGVSFLPCRDYAYFIDRLEKIR